MKLTSRDGAFLDLQPAGYQYPDMSPAAAGNNWDPNWLMVHGEAGTAEQQAWMFLTPCLTTWEARDLSGWLRTAAAGDVPPPGRGLAFTEPTLAFEVDDADGDRAGVRIRFCHEALPAWLPGDRPDGLASEFVLLLDVNRGELTRAADAWDRACSAFPER